MTKNKIEKWKWQKVESKNEMKKIEKWKIIVSKNEKWKIIVTKSVNRKIKLLIKWKWQKMKVTKNEK